jgi:hypothetical protein
MRLNDLSDGSIKTLLILGLLFANIAVALPGHGSRSPKSESKTPRFFGRMHEATSMDEGVHP